jgi:hypothetical protein
MRLSPCQSLAATNCLHGTKADRYTKGLSENIRVIS